MQGFLIFALGGGWEVVEAGARAAGEKTKRNFEGDKSYD